MSPELEGLELLPTSKGSRGSRSHSDQRPPSPSNERLLANPSTHYTGRPEATLPLHSRECIALSYRTSDKWQSLLWPSLTSNGTFARANVWLVGYSFSTQGCSATSPWHSLICSGVHSSGLPFSFSRCSQPCSLSIRHIYTASFFSM